MYKRNFKSGPPRGRSRFPQRGGPSRGRRSFPQQRIDISRYINKAVITEAVEHFVPEHNFSDFSVDERLKANITAKGYVTPTPIQDRTIPHILRGQDVVGIANTGTGKTAAFLIPLLNKTLLDPSERVLIMVPTRELAQQIADEAQGLSKRLPVSGAVCVGGAGIGAQIAALRRRPQFVIGTPGRLKDLLERRVLVLSDFKSVVLDEADRMLDMGFIHDMRAILALLPSPRQTLFFSATLSREIEKLIGEFLREPVRISVKTQETPESVEQDVVRVPAGKNKLDVLGDMLSQAEFSKVLIFGRTKHGVEKLAKTLVDRGFRAESIHGNKTQGRREKALDLFKRDHVQVLVATDVAARGLDIVGVSHVINYDLPASHDDYIHRIGRTGRAGKKGKALTFVE
ncbi:DEAD/DEAH box helicase [Candidatus Kaiserbacteria bacterium]|nr:DEAD/DEAH box helicase [Candidatus Kaiserbacteria bacterium]